MLGSQGLCNNCEPGFEYVSGHCVKPPGCQALLPDFSRCIACATISRFMYEASKNTCNCFYGHYPISQNSVSFCLPKCGDGILISPDEQCDDGNIRNQDGCDQNCRLEPDFNCTSDSPSQCTLEYTPVLLEYNYAYRYEGTNRCKFSLNLAPSYPSMKYVNWSSYLAFNLSDSDIVKSSMPYFYNELTNQLIIEIEYLRTIENMTVEFRLFDGLPLAQGVLKVTNESKNVLLNAGKEEGSNQEISVATSKQASSNYVSLELKKEISLIVQLQGQNSKLLFQNQTLYTVFQTVQITSLIISILILLQFLIGSYYHKMIGLETLQVLQFFYFVRLIVQQNLTSLLQSMNVFKYTAYGGYSDTNAFINEASESFIPLTYKTVGPNFVTVELTKYFFTNVNIPLILPSLALMAFIFTLVRKYSKRNEYLKLRDILLKDQYTTLRRSSQWVYDHFVFPYLNLFNMVIFFSTILYLKFKPNRQHDELQGSPIIKTIQKINFPIHLAMAFLVLLIYCSQFFTSLEEFNNSRLSEAEKARVPKSTYQKIEHDENNPDRPNYKPGYILFYMTFYMLVEMSLMFDILFDQFFSFGVEILLGITSIYLIFVWKWNPYNKAVQFHNKTLRLNHFSIVFFMSINAIVKRVQISMTVYLVLVYATTVLLLLVTLCGFLRIVVEHRFRKRLLDEPWLMETGGRSNKKASLQERRKEQIQKKQNLIKKNPFLFQNQVKQMLAKKGRANIDKLTENQIEEAKYNMRRQIYSDKERMDSIKKEKHFNKEEPDFMNDFVGKHFKQEGIMALDFKKEEIRRRRKKV